MVRTLRVGTRRSALALAQTELVLTMLGKSAPEARLEMVPLSTEGDERTDVSLRELGGTGAFVKRIERALLGDQIDLAVHSLKDVPTELEPGLLLAAIPERADPRDALVLPRGTSELKQAARVGTGSARRAAQLLLMRPDLRLEDVRGNVDTRLRKLDEGQYDALVLAAAGLQRLGRADRITRLLEPEELTPMVGQGALVIEARREDLEAVTVAATIDHRTTRICVEAERAFLARLGGGCRLPVGALATIDGGHLRMQAMLGDNGGRRIERLEGAVSVADGFGLAERLADELLAAVNVGATP
jgi:hydroxymethylbilane synthase